MGSGNSKPESTYSQHVFSADAPVRFSNNLVDKLQNNTQSDSTRSRTQELEFQSRLTSELEKLSSAESAKLSQLSSELSQESESSSPSLTEKLSDAVSSKSTLDAKHQQENMDRNFVSKEIETLKKKLESRKKIEELDKDVARAKEDVVTCLRINDRRPLDCWKEVERFREEVGRLERGFVERTVR